MAPSGSLSNVWLADAVESQGRLQALLSAARTERFRSILLRADRIAVGIPIAAVVVVAVCSDCRGAGRRPVSCSAIDASADRGARHRPSRDSVSSTGNAVATAMNRSNAGTSVITSTPVATATAATCERIIRHEAGADQNDCCQCSEGISKHGLFSCHACGVQQFKARSDLHPGTAFDDEWMEA
jgi:hypothetical protein